MKFTIENFFQFNGEGKTKAGFSVSTEGGMYYDMKLVEYNGGYFVAAAQSRAYDKSDGSKGYARAFGAIKGTPAAKFFDDVAIQAVAELNVKETFSQPHDGPVFNPDDNIHF